MSFGAENCSQHAPLLAFSFGCFAKLYVWYCISQVLVLLGCADCISSGDQEERSNSVTIGIADEHMGLVVGRGGRNISEISQVNLILFCLFLGDDANRFSSWFLN